MTRVIGTVLLKVPKDQLMRAKKNAETMGLSFNTVINGLIRQFNNNPEIRFFAPLVPNKKTLASLKKIERDRARGDASAVFTDVDTAFDWMLMQK